MSSQQNGKARSENGKNNNGQPGNGRHGLNSFEKAPARGPVRQVRVKRPKETDKLDQPASLSISQKNTDIQIVDTAHIRKKSKIAVLKPSAKKESVGENKTELKNESVVKAIIEKSPKVHKRSEERHIHFSDEQDKYKAKTSGVDETNDARKRSLQDKREWFRLSKSSYNSEHVSGEELELTPFVESKTVTKHVSPGNTRKNNKREEIPLKELAKSAVSSEIPLKELAKSVVSSAKNVVTQHLIKHSDHRDSQRITHEDERSKPLDTRTSQRYKSTSPEIGRITDHPDYVKRFSQSPKEHRNIKPDTVIKTDKGTFKQGLPKHFLSPDISTPIIEKSKSQQRLQNQSSTETSGLGDTITSGFSSQESITSVHSNCFQTSTSKTAPGVPSHLPFQEDLGIDLREDTTDSKNEDNSTYETKTIDSQNVINGKNEPGNYSENIKSRFINKSGPIHGPSGSSTRAVDTTVREISDKAIRYRPMKEQVDQHQIHFLGPADQLNNNGSSKKKRGSQPNTSPELGKLGQEGGYHAVTDFDELFQQSETLPIPQPTMGLGIEQINNEWNRHTRSSSIKSIRSNRSSIGSFRSRSGSTRRSRRFLGEKESKWMKWGKERRASFRRRLNKLEQPEPEVPPRPSTPIKKARQEGLMFIHPDLESKYISEEDINYIQRHRQQRLQTYKVIEKSKNVRYQHDRAEFCRLTANDLNILTRFWEHRIFVRSRYISILLSFITVVIYIISICSSHWITYPSIEVLGAEAHEGLWYGCRPAYLEGNNLEEICDQSAQRGPQEELSFSLREPACEHIDLNETLAEACPDSLPNWQNAVIGLMIFSSAFGFVAAVLAVLGVCTSPLPKKIYYFHSAGEIFFVCALSTTVALIIYPVAIAMDITIHSHTFGSGYRLGWGGAAFFYAASFCMSLDELVRESAQNKCCRYLCWRTRDRGEQQNV